MTKVDNRQAAKLLKNGELVILPTETVYGLAADATSHEAVSKIFAAKNRPPGNPLIVHVSDLAMMEELVYGITDREVLLMNKFWPGPLTMVFQKTALIPQIVTAGLETVCIRIPNHDQTLEIIKKLGRPIAAPSANISGRPSPTRVEHLQLNLPYVDGGICKFGLESTVLDMRGTEPVILRPGAVTKEALEEVLNCPVRYAQMTNASSMSPGSRFKHYSPDGKVRLFNDQSELLKLLNERIEASVIHEINFGVIVTKKYSELYQNADAIILPDDIPGQAALIYDALLQTERRGWKEVLVDLNGIGAESGLGVTVLERLKRAAE